MYDFPLVIVSNLKQNANRLKRCAIVKSTCTKRNTSRKSRVSYHTLSRCDFAVVVELKDGSDFGGAMPRQDGDLGERADGAQSLASKAERRDGEQVVERRQLRRRVFRRCSVKPKPY